MSILAIVIGESLLLYRVGRIGGFAGYVILISVCVFTPRVIPLTKMFLILPISAVYQPMHQSLATIWTVALAIRA